MIPHPVHLQIRTPAIAQADTKGWFDEQQIAIQSSGTPPVTPMAFATVVPVPALASITLAQFNKEPMPVAMVFMSDSVNQYFRKFGFTPGWNLIALQGAAAASSPWGATIDRLAWKSRAARYADTRIRSAPFLVRRLGMGVAQQRRVDLGGLRNRILFGSARRRLSGSRHECSRDSV